MATITLSINQVAILDHSNAKVDIISVPEILPYDTIEEWLCCREKGLGYNLDEIDWTHKGE